MLNELSLFDPCVIAEVEKLNAVQPDPPKPVPFELDHEFVLLKMHKGDRAALDNCATCQWFLQHQRSHSGNTNP